MEGFILGHLTALFASVQISRRWQYNSIVLNTILCHVALLQVRPKSYFFFVLYSSLKIAVYFLVLSVPIALNLQCEII